MPERKTDVNAPGDRSRIAGSYGTASRTPSHPFASRGWYAPATAISPFSQLSHRDAVRAAMKRTG